MYLKKKRTLKGKREVLTRNFNFTGDRRQAFDGQPTNEIGLQTSRAA